MEPIYSFSELFFGLLLINNVFFFEKPLLVFDL